MSQTPSHITIRFTKAMNELIGRSVKNKKEFARKLNVPPPQLHRWIRGESVPTIQNILDLVQNFDINPTWLILGKGEMYLKATESLIKRIERIEKQLKITR